MTIQRGINLKMAKAAKYYLKINCRREKDLRSDCPIFISEALGSG